MTVEDVLREMDAMAQFGHADLTGEQLRIWLGVLRPFVAQRLELMNVMRVIPESEATLRAEVERLRGVVKQYETRDRDQSQSPGLPRGLTTWYTGDTPPPNPDVEVFPIKSGLPQRLLRDLGVTIELRADHEGTGEIRIDYSKAPPERRLQALLSVMGAVGDRIALAIGNESYVNLLRGIVARREREL